MLKVAPLILIAALSASSQQPLSIASQHAPQSYANKPPPNSNSTDDYQRGSEKVPFVVEVRYADEREHHATAAQQKHNDGWFYGWSVGDKITLVVAVIAFFQFIALLATYSVMRRTARHQLRAYVSVEDIVLYSPNIDNPEYDTPNPLPPTFVSKDCLRVTIKNNGQTPALNAAVFLNWKPFPPFTILPSGFVLKNYVTPQQIASSTRQILDTNRAFTHTVWINSTLALFREAIADRNRVFFYGWVEYTDIFGTKWIRNYRYTWQPNAIGDDRLYPTPEGNSEHRIRKKRLISILKRMVPKAT